MLRRPQDIDAEPLRRRGDEGTAMGMLAGRMLQPPVGHPRFPIDMHADQPELFAQVFVEFFRDGRVSRATAERAGVSTRREEIPTLVEPRQTANV